MVNTARAEGPESPSSPNCYPGTMTNCAATGIVIEREREPVENRADIPDIRTEHCDRMSQGMV